MTASFEDIVIVDLDVRKTTWSSVHSSMRTLYLQLTREPDMDWARFFHEEREARIVVKRHGLWIEDGYIVFDCLLDDVETYHLPDSRLSIAYANRKCRELVETCREQTEQARQDSRAEQQELTVLRELIRDPGQLRLNSAARASSKILPAPAPAPAPSAAVSTDVGETQINARRDEWRARFRAALASRNKALASRNKESDRGND